MVAATDPRDELARAVSRIAKAAKLGMIEPEEVDEGMISNFLDTAELPDPDLIIVSVLALSMAAFDFYRDAFKRTGK